MKNYKWIIIKYSLNLVRVIVLFCVSKQSGFHYTQILIDEHYHLLCVCVWKFLRVYVSNLVTEVQV